MKIRTNYWSKITKIIALLPFIFAQITSQNCAFAKKINGNNIKKNQNITKIIANNSTHSNKKDEQIVPQPQNEPNEQFIIIGNKNVPKENIYNAITFTNSELANEEEINKSLKKLYEMEVFSNVKIYKNSSKKIVIEIKENPVIFDIKIEGSKKIDSKILQNELSLKKRGIFTNSKLQNDIKRIMEIYIKSGRFLTQIEPKILLKQSGLIEITLEIQEGPKAKISNINFLGNNNFSKSDLINAILTKESKWYKFLSSNDSFDFDRLEIDKENLRKFYHAKGYADFNISSTSAQLMPNKTQFIINFLLTEGEKYKINQVKIVNLIKNFDETPLNKKIKISLVFSKLRKKFISL